MGEWGAGRGAEAGCLSRSTDARVGDPSSRSLNSNEAADTRMGAALLVPSTLDPLAEVKDATLDADGLGLACPCTCAISEHTSDGTSSDGTVCELSTRLENLTSCAGGEWGVYVVQGDAMYTLYPGLDRICVGGTTGDRGTSNHGKLEDTLYKIFH